MRAVTASGGEFTCASDPSIVAAALRLAASTGVPPEAAARAFADLLKHAQEHPDSPRPSTAVILITGRGLKDTSIFLSNSTRGQSRGELRHVPTPLAEVLT